MEECPNCGPHTEAVHGAALWYHPEKLQRHAIQEQYDQMQFPDVFSDRRER